MAEDPIMAGDTNTDAMDDGRDRPDYFPPATAAIVALATMAR
jgi:hypothetical protein